MAPFTDPISGLSFPDFFANPPLQPPSLVQPSLIFPVPCEFISPDLPYCAVIRPSDDRFAGAQATIAFLTKTGLLTGHSAKFYQTLMQLAEAADATSRQFWATCNLGAALDGKAGAASAQPRLCCQALPLQFSSKPRGDYWASRAQVSYTVPHLGKERH